MSRRSPLLIASVALGLSACSYSGDWLFPPVDERVPSVIDLGRLEPAEVTTLDELRASIHYGELSPTGTAEIGGATFTFEGTNGSVCVWVDPETVYWSQSVAVSNPQAYFSYPDNIKDDGDIDLYAGLSVYYSGSPGVTIGDFEVRYQDHLGNSIPVEFNQCLITSVQYPTGGAHSGRATPEYCTLNNTQVGASYTVAMHVFSPPMDDNRLGYGLIFTEGNCEQLRSLNPTNVDECLILGESIRPDHGHDYREDPFLAIGHDEVEDYSWEGSVAFEGLFCAAAGAADLALLQYCRQEAEDIPVRRDCDLPDVRCYCGDVANTPTGGSR
jgi:hypothetical protein